MNLYSNRRNKVLKAISDNAAVMLFSGKAPMRSEDEAYPFTVDRNFYYLTGLDKEEMVLLMYTIDGISRQTLFIQPYDETMARWVGGRMLKEEASEISEIEDVRDISELDNVIASLMNRTRRIRSFGFFFDFWHYEMEQSDTLASRYAKKLKDRYPYINTQDLFAIMAGLRLLKDEYEISCIRKAIHTTNIGIQQMMRTIKPGINEMSLEGVFNFVLAQSLCNENAFKTIAASGKRATILHYSDNNQIVGDDELFLCDLGATYDHYCADISRTFPANGHFSERQKEIYQIVLRAQQIVEENARVGANMRDLNKMVVDFYRNELPLHGLKKDVSEYYFHSVSHHLGLDTHDIDGGLGTALQAGNVITNEPGLYIADEGIGIRIEDDLLITGTGCEVLSAEIIKDPDEIEAFMNSNQQ